MRRSASSTNAVSAADAIRSAAQASAGDISIPFDTTIDLGFKVGRDLLEVIHVEKDSQAALAGVKQGWSLCSVNGKLVTDRKGLSETLLAVKTNDERLVPMRFAWNSQSAFDALSRFETIGTDAPPHRAFAPLLAALVRRLTNPHHLLTIP